MKDVKKPEEITGDGFTRKKVESLTLGEKMRKLRSEYRMSLQEISKATKIQVKYLEYLENGEYGKLPAEVYVRGFLTSYARHLGLDEEIFLRLYDKEKNIQANLGKEAKFETKPRMPLAPALVISSRSIVFALIVLIIFGTFFYLFHQFRSFVSEPELVILDPLNGATIEGSTVTVKGKTDKGARVTVNGQGVFVGNDGIFTQPLVLQSGLNTVTVVAVNRFEKEKTESVSFEAHFETPAAETAQQAQSHFLLTVSAEGKQVHVTLVSDGTTTFSGLLKPGDSQTAEAGNEITLSTDDAQHTRVSFKGGIAAPLGDKATPLQSVKYTSAGRQ